MEYISLNEIQTDNNILLTDVPNILKVEEYDAEASALYADRSYAYFTISGATSLPVTSDGQYTIMFEGETISNVIDPSNAYNKNFYISRQSGGDKATAASIARAFRNCATIAANWTVQTSGSTVMLDAKNPVTTDTRAYYQDMMSPSWNGKIIFSGSDAQDLCRLTGAKVMVDIYKGYDTDYITTLEKTCNINSVAFNLSPILTTFAEYGKAVPFRYRVSFLTTTGDYVEMNEPDDDVNYISIGYMVNQGNKYLINDGVTIAQNVSRGESWLNETSDRGNIVNRSLLYIYEPYIPFSFYKGNLGGATVYIDYLDSAFNRIGSATTTWHNQGSSELLINTGFTLADTTAYKAMFDDAFYIDLTFGTQVLRYNVIKPLYATEANHRIYWRNSYNGISFFDFSGKKTETRSLKVQTYNKNIYDYYTNNEINELEKVYDNDVEYEVTLKSHLFENDGKYIFNDLLQSANVWTEVNGQNYAIIVNSVSVEELDSNNDIYEATIKFHYSQKPSALI